MPHDDILHARMPNTHTCVQSSPSPFQSGTRLVTSALPRVAYLLRYIKLHFIPERSANRLDVGSVRRMESILSPEKHKPQQCAHTHTHTHTLDHQTPVTHMLACTNSQTHMLLGGSMESIRCTLERPLTKQHLFQLSPLVTLKLHPSPHAASPPPPDTQTLFFSCFLALNSSVQPCQVLIEA